MTNKQFNSDMLFIARQARGFSQEEATKRTQLLSQPTYSRVEAGLRVPTTEEIDAIARGLNVKSGFLFHPFVRRPMPAIFHRKRQKLTNRDWEHVFAKSEIKRICIALMSNSVRITPKISAPPQIDPSIVGASDAATAVRQAWMLPRGPVSDLTRLLESAGIIVVAFDFGTDLIDGFSERTQDSLPPLVFVNTRQPRDRLRFTLAHELGHIVMHRVPYPEMEDEANAFASEFLMPTEDISNDFFAFSPDHFMLLKGKWKTSIASLIRKARDLDKITQHQYTEYNIDLIRMGWKKNEPLPLPDDIEVPRTVSALVGAHTGQLGYSSEELSEMFGLPKTEVEDEFGLAKPRPKLRLVISD